MYMYIYVYLMLSPELAVSTTSNNLGAPTLSIFDYHCTAATDNMSVCRQCHVGVI